MDITTAQTNSSNEEPQEVIFLHGIWRHIKEFGIEGQIPRISSPVRLEVLKGVKKPQDPKQHVNQNITWTFSLMNSYHAAKLELDIH